MKKLFGQISYTFNNFYDNLNNQGQIVFTLIIGLIVILLLMLLITFMIQKIKNKKSINELLNKQLNIKNNQNKQEVKEEIKDVKTKEKIEVESIAKRVEDALSYDSPISLTSFEEDQERTAIISIDELMKRAKELDLIDDEKTNINYLEKYNLEPKVAIDTAKKAMSTKKQEVKAFKVSQVISPIYGVKKDEEDY